MLNVKNGKTTNTQNNDKAKMKQDLNNLETVSASDLNLPDEYMEILK